MARRGYPPGVDPVCWTSDLGGVSGGRRPGWVIPAGTGKSSGEKPSSCIDRRIGPGRRWRDRLGSWMVRSPRGCNKLVRLNGAVCSTWMSGPGSSGSVDKTVS